MSSENPWRDAHPDSPALKVTRGEHLPFDFSARFKYLDHAKVVEQGIREGGITVLPEPGAKPLTVGESDSKWYGVGGAKNPSTGERVPEESIPMNPNVSGEQFGTNHALRHILRVEGYNIERQASRTPTGKKWKRGFVGGWNEMTPEGPKAVLDYTSVYKSRKGAVKSASERGERAVFDAKNVSEIDTDQAWQEYQAKDAARKAQKDAQGR